MSAAAVSASAPRVGWRVRFPALASAAEQMLGVPSQLPLEHFGLPLSSSVVRFSSHASAFELQRFALARLADVRVRGEAILTQDALESLDAVLTQLVADDGPTPQLGATPSGSVEVQWLVDGTLVAALFDESGGCNVFVVDASDETLIDEELPRGVFPESLLSTLRSMLKEMSSRIVERPPSWSHHGQW